MIEAQAVPAHFSVGRVVTRTFDVIAKNFRPFCGVAFLVVVPQLVFQWWWGTNALLRAVRRAGVGSVPRLVFEHQGAVLLVSGLANCILYAALVYGTMETLKGNPPRFFEYLSTGLKYFPRVAPVGLLQLLIIVLAFMLFIVPGFIVATMLCVSTSVCVSENKSVLDSLARSAELTSGHRWTIFGPTVVSILFGTGLRLAIRPLAGLSFFPWPHALHAPIPLDVFSIFMLASTALRAVTSAIFAVGFASIYYELRTIKECVGPEQLAAVFA